MKRTLFLTTTPFKTTKTLASIVLLLLFTVGLSSKASAQCIGPYQGYESSTAAIANLTAKGWQLGQASGTSTFTTVSAQSRSGRYCLQHVNTVTVGAYIQTPVIATPENFTFYVKKATAGQAINSYLFISTVFFSVVCGDICKNPNQAIQDGCLENPTTKKCFGRT